MATQLFSFGKRLAGTSTPFNATMYRAHSILLPWQYVSSNASAVLGISGSLSLKNMQPLNLSQSAIVRRLPVFLERIGHTIVIGKIARNLCPSVTRSVLDMAERKRAVFGVKTARDGQFQRFAASLYPG
ncbi:MAG: hypothetical protein ACLQLC_20105 [Candidatus Sulfotelmatobacter sp.]